MLPQPSVQPQKRQPSTAVKDDALPYHTTDSVGMSPPFSASHFPHPEGRLFHPHRVLTSATNSLLKSNLSCLLWDTPPSIDDLPQRELKPVAYRAGQRFSANAGCFTFKRISVAWIRALNAEAFSLRKRGTVKQPGEVEGDHLHRCMAPLRSAFKDQDDSAFARCAAAAHAEIGVAAGAVINEPLHRP
jgi:hypothetical protein